MHTEMSTLEDSLAGITIASELQPRADVLSTWARLLLYLNNAIYQQHLGDKLFQNLRAVASKYDIALATKVIDLARVRAAAHVENGKYKREYERVDNCIEELPMLVASLLDTPERQSIDAFLAYCSRYNTDFPVKELPAAFNEFTAVKNFYTSIPHDCKDLIVWRDDLARGDWKLLRSQLSPEKSADDKKYVEWSHKIEDAEKLHANFDLIYACLTALGAY